MKLAWGELLLPWQPPDEGCVLLVALLCVFMCVVFVLWAWFAVGVNQQHNESDADVSPLGCTAAAPALCFYWFLEHYITIQRG